VMERLMPDGLQPATHGGIQNLLAT
jgi:hypothetical protein